jgi:hypothetical protein
VAAAGAAPRAGTVEDVRECSVHSKVAAAGGAHLSSEKEPPPALPRKKAAARVAPLPVPLVGAVPHEARAGAPLARPLTYNPLAEEDGGDKEGRREGDGADDNVWRRRLRGERGRWRSTTPAAVRREHGGAEHLRSGQRGAQAPRPRTEQQGAIGCRVAAGAVGAPAMWRSQVSVLTVARAAALARVDTGRPNLQNIATRGPPPSTPDVCYSRARTVDSPRAVNSARPRSVLQSVWSCRRASGCSMPGCDETQGAAMSVTIHPPMFDTARSAGIKL